MRCAAWFGWFGDSRLGCEAAVEVAAWAIDFCKGRLKRSGPSRPSKTLPVFGIGVQCNVQCEMNREVGIEDTKRRFLLDGLTVAERGSEGRGQ